MIYNLGIGSETEGRAKIFLNRSTCWVGFRSAVNTAICLSVLPAIKAGITPPAQLAIVAPSKRFVGHTCISQGSATAGEAQNRIADVITAMNVCRLMVPPALDVNARYSIARCSAIAVGPVACAMSMRFRHLQNARAITSAPHVMAKARTSAVGKYNRPVERPQLALVD